MKNSVEKDPVDPILNSNASANKVALGFSVSGVGDVNGDGYEDLIIGAPPSATSTGRVYVISGQSSFSASLDGSNLNGSNGFIIEGIDSQAQVENSNALALRDLNGDCCDDLVIGTIWSCPTLAGSSTNERVSLTQANVSPRRYGHFNSTSSNASVDTATSQEPRQGPQLSRGGGSE